MSSLPADLVERVSTRHPVPVADAVAALVASDSAHETRDRVVECFRAQMRLAGALALAARVQYGPGPAAVTAAEAEQAPDASDIDRSGAIVVAGVDRPEVIALLRSLRSRGLTDGQWVGLTRALLRPWAGAAGSHPLPLLVELFHGSRRSRFVRVVDGLLQMRKSETVAHGATGGVDAIRALLAKRMPQLATLLKLFEPLWEQARLVAPVAESASDANALLLMGQTPGHGRFQRITLAADLALPPEQAVLVDGAGRPLLALAPVALLWRANPAATWELFVLDGSRRRRAVYVALPSMAEHYDADAWQVLDGHLAAAPSAALADAAARPSSRPYRGLASFDSRHSELFFGRDREIEVLANRIRKHGMVTVTGASGSGKTSLLCAGVLPVLVGFRAVIMRPGGAPLDALQQRLASVLAEGARGEVHGDLSPSAEPVTDPAGEPTTSPADNSPVPVPSPSPSPSPSGDELVAWCRRAGVRLLVCVDQTEELFTLCRDERQRTGFAELLARMAAADADGPIRVVLSIRGDFFARLAELPALAGRYSRNVEVVTTPNQDALLEILRRPARAFGYQFEDDKLLRAMLEPLSEEPAALAVLQFAADRMWELRDRQWQRLTWAAYDAVGGVAGALAAHADAVIEQLTRGQRQLARALFMRLVTAEGTREVVATQALLDVAGPGARAVLDQLVAARLVVVHEADEGTADVELMHEALLTHWARLRSWLDDDREHLRIRDRVATAAAHWIHERTASAYLLPEGKPLAEAEALLAERPEILEHNQVEFIVASRRRRARRRLWARVAVTLVLIIATGAGLAGLYAWNQGKRASREAAQRHTAQEKAMRAGLMAEASEERARLSADEAGARANEAALARARAVIDHDPTAAIAWLHLLDTQVQTRRGAIFDEARLLAATAHASGIAEHVLAGHASGVTRIAFRPDGGAFASGSEDGDIAIWDPTTGERRSMSGHKDQILDLAFSPDGRYLASVGADATARLSRADGSQTTELTGHTDSVTSLAFAPHGDRLATGGRDRAVLLWDLDALTAPLERFADFQADITDVEFSGNGIYLATASADGAIRLWNQATGDSSELLGHGQRVDAIAFAPDSRTLASVSRDRTVRLWHTADGQGVVLGEDAGQTVAFTADGQRVLTMGADDALRLWSVAGEPVVTLRGHAGAVEQAVLVTGDAQVVSVGSDETVRVWPVPGAGQVAARQVLRGHGDMVHALAVSPDGALAVSGARDGELRVWRLASDAQSLTGHQEIATSVAISPDGTRVVASAADGAIAMWRAPDADTGFRFVHRFSGHTGMINHIGFAPDGTRQVTAGDDGSARVWSASVRGATSVPQHQVAHDGPVWYALFSPDGERVATASDDGTVHLLHLPSGADTVLRGHEKAVVHAAFSADGTRLVTASWDGSARLWDVASGAQERVFAGHEQAVVRVAISPDGALVASGSRDRSARVYALDGTLLQHLRGHTGELYDLAFSPDGALLATASADRTVRVWPLVGEDSESAEVTARYTLRGHADEVVSLAFAPTGERLLTASLDGAVWLWQLQLGARGRVLAGHTGEVNQIVVSGDGRVIASASDDRTIGIWRDAMPADTESFLDWLAQASRARWDGSGQLRSRLPAHP